MLNLQSLATRMSSSIYTSVGPVTATVKRCSELRCRRASASLARFSRDLCGLWSLLVSLHMALVLGRSSWVQRAIKLQKHPIRPPKTHNVLLISGTHRCLR